MAKKIDIEINYNEEENCQRCDAKGAMDFAGELLCMQCACNDVFETMNENQN